MKFFIYVILFFIYGLLHADTPILILHSYHETYPWSSNQDKGFRSVVDAQKNFYPFYSTEYIDSKRRGLDENYEQELVHYFREKYQGYSPEVIYVTDDDALHFMLHHKEKIFPSSSVVFSGINEISKKNILSEKEYAGVFEKKDFLTNIELIKSLFPQEKEILFLGDTSTTAKVMEEQLENLRSKTLDINVQSLSGEDYETTLSRLQNYKGKIILFTTIGGFQTKDKKIVTLKQVISEIVAMKKFIIFTLEDTYLNYGVLGGYMNSAFTQGKEAGKVAIKILEKRQVEFPKSIESPSILKFDFEALQKNKITLPKEISKQSELINKPESLAHKYEKALFSLLYLLIAVIIVGSLFFARSMYKSRQTILQREESLAKMTQSMDKAQSIAHLGHWDWNIQNNTLWWSDEIYRIFGLAPQTFQATYEAFLEYVHPADKIKVQEAVNKALETKSNYQIIHKIIREDGVERYVREEGTLKLDRDGQPYNMIGIVHDITEEYEQEIALLLQSEIFNAVQDSIMVHDMDGRFIYLNENAWKTRGYTEAELMNLTVKELDAPQYRNDPKRMEDAFKKMQEEGHIRLRVEHVCKNGELLPVEIYSKFIELEGKFYILSSVRDISEQVKAQEAIEASEKKYRDLVENAMVGIYRTDLLGNIQYVNPALAKMLQCDSVEEVLSDSALKIYKSPRERENFLKILQEQGHVSNYELEAYNKNNNAFPVMLSATLEDGILSGMMIDMTEIKQAHAEIEKLSKVVEQIDDSVMITDKKGVITYVNDAFFKHTGYSREEAVGKTPSILKSNHYEPSFYIKLWNTILSGNVFIDTLINRKKNGALFYEKKTITPLKDDLDNIIGFVSSGKDVTLETMMHKEIETIASTDKLTGIYNRYKFEELFILEIERARRFGKPLALIMLDIDHFKRVNDTYGHDVGDKVLMHLAKVVQESIRKLDIFARWGGEEFLILAPNTDADQVLILAEKLRAAVESSDFPTVKNITVSLGVTILQEEDNFDELFKRADQALYNSKNKGRNHASLVN